MTKFNRILIKLSGEGFASPETKLLDANKLAGVIREIKLLLENNVQVAIVIGGGNICRGSAGSGSTPLNRNTLDSVGMISTLINGLVLSDILTQNNIDSVVMSAMEISKIADFYNVVRAREHLSKGRVTIIVGGIACSFFSTDTAAVVRAVELDCCGVLKATQVDGVYTADPKTNPDAKKLDTITYDEFIDQRLKVIDLTAVMVAKLAQIPIYILPTENTSLLSQICFGVADNKLYSIIKQ